MKYKNLRIDPNLVFVETTRVCSHCKSGVPLRGTENFCPDCGAKLKHIPCKLDKEAIIALVNENIDKLPNPLTVEPNANINDHCSTQSSVDDHEGWEATNREKETTGCPHCKGTPETCGYCTSKGACTFLVLTSFPPQYRMCPFRGSGYIKCKDAE